MSHERRSLSRGSSPVRGVVVAASLLAAVCSSMLPQTAASAEASCPIRVSDFGYDLVAAQTALNSVTPTCRTVLFSAGTFTFNGKLKISTTAVTVTGEPGAVIQPAAGTVITGGLLQIGGTGVTVTGLDVIGSPDKGIEAHGASDFEVSNNVVQGSRTIGIHLLRSTGGTVADNTVFRNRSNAVDMHGSTWMVVRNNELYLNGGPRWPETLEGNGIIAYASQHIDILSNTIYDNSQTRPGTRDGIRVSDNNGLNGEMVTRYITIDGNLIYDDQPTATQGWAINFWVDKVYGPGGIDFVSVTNNTGYGNIHAGIRTRGLAPGATYVDTNNNLAGR
jgi:parallel beta-helix repeat protein